MVSAWLRERADSYWRDARALREDGDLRMSVAYEAISHELRQLAEQIDGSGCGS